MAVQRKPYSYRNRFRFSDRLLDKVNEIIMARRVDQEGEMFRALSILIAHPHRRAMVRYVSEKGTGFFKGSIEELMLDLFDAWHDVKAEMETDSDRRLGYAVYREVRYIALAVLQEIGQFQGRAQVEPNSGVTMMQEEDILREIGQRYGSDLSGALLHEEG